MHITTPRGKLWRVRPDCRRSPVLPWLCHLQCNAPVVALSACTVQPLAWVCLIKIGSWTWRDAASKALNYMPAPQTDLQWQINLIRAEKKGRNPRARILTKNRWFLRTGGNAVDMNLLSWRWRIGQSVFCEIFLTLKPFLQEHDLELGVKRFIGNHKIRFSWFGKVWDIKCNQGFPWTGISPNSRITAKVEKLYNPVAGVLRSESAKWAPRENPFQL